MGVKHKLAPPLLQAMLWQGLLLLLGGTRAAMGLAGSTQPGLPGNRPDGFWYGAGLSPPVLVGLGHKSEQRLRNSVERDVLDVPSCLGKASRRKGSLFPLFFQLKRK